MAGRINVLFAVLVVLAASCNGAKETPVPESESWYEKDFPTTTVRPPKPEYADKQYEYLDIFKFAACCWYFIVLGFVIVLGIIASVVAYCMFGKGKQKLQVVGLEDPPSWTHTVYEKPEDIIVMWDPHQCSDGLVIQPDGRTVYRNCPQIPRVTLGIRVNKPLTHGCGKHIFEFLWEKEKRGTHATIGLGTRESPLHLIGTYSLVGHTHHSWGWDMRRRRVINRGEIESVYPPRLLGSDIPAKILMYIDMDEGTVAFGTDLGYWGKAFDVPYRDGVEWYPMVGISKQGSLVSVRYLGCVDPEATNTFKNVANSNAMDDIPPSYDEVTQDSDDATKASSVDIADLPPIQFENVPTNPLDESLTRDPLSLLMAPLHPLPPTSQNYKAPEDNDKK